MGKRDLVSVDGGRLRVLIAGSGRRQKEVASEAGITRHRLSRITITNQTATITSTTAEGLAKALGVSVSELSADSKKTNGDANLLPQEREIVKMFRQMGPIEQARTLVELSEKLEKEDAHEGEGDDISQQG